MDIYYSKPVGVVGQSYRLWVKLFYLDIFPDDIFLIDQHGNIYLPTNPSYMLSKLHFTFDDSVYDLSGGHDRVYKPGKKEIYLAIKVSVVEHIIEDTWHCTFTGVQVEYVESFITN